MPKIGQGKSVDVIAPAGGVVGGRFYYVGGFIGMAFVNTVGGARVALDIEANGRYNVESADTVAVNDKVFFDITNDTFTTTETAGETVFMGIADRASDADGFFWFTKFPVNI